MRSMVAMASIALRAAHAAVGIAEQLEVGEQPARTDAEHEAAAAHVIELRDFGGDDGRIVVRQADHAGAEFQVFGARHEARHEHQRRGDRLGGRGKMLAEPHLVEAERVGVKRLLLVLGQRVGERARRRMHRHHEYSEAHLVSPSSRSSLVMLREGGASSNHFVETLALRASSTTRLLDHPPSRMMTVGALRRHHVRIARRHEAGKLRRHVLGEQPHRAEHFFAASPSSCRSRSTACRSRRGSS